MKFKTDENLPLQAAELLRDAGHDADSVLDEGLSGTSDPNLALRLQQENRALVTLDLDFSNILTYPPENYAGLVVLRTKSQDIPTILSLVRKSIPLLSMETLAGHLWIVEANGIRIR